jgi:hypothetical protein
MIRKRRGKSEGTPLITLFKETPFPRKAEGQEEKEQERERRCSV